MMLWKEGPRRQGAEKTKRARVLRQQMTDAERYLWRALKNRTLSGVKFRRQVPLGPYYLDFYSAEAKMAIELDGGQHYRAQGKKRDERRDAYIQSLGIKVIRYSDRDVLLHLEKVLEEIRGYLHESSP
ncbi:MAG: endonuclease domain-containing protein [Nitrospiria bacterium]